MEHEAFKFVNEKDESQMLKNTNAAKVTAGFGAAAATLHAVPELNADVVNLTFSPGTVIFSTDQSKVDVNLGTTGGAFLGSIGQYNDSVGKSMDTQTGIRSMTIVSSGQEIGGPTFVGNSSISFSTSASGIVYIGFTTGSGRVGWFSVDLGGFTGTITYAGGQYGTDGESVTVGSSTPVVPGLGGLAALGVGATGLRGRRQRAAAS